MASLGDEMASAYFRGDVRDMTKLLFRYVREGQQPPAPPAFGGPTGQVEEELEDEDGTGE